MKNIHLVLAGESRLSLNRSYRDYAIGTEAGEPYWTYSQYKHHMSVTDASVRPHNMYITSEEKFVRDEYVTDGIEVIKATPKLAAAQGLVDRRDWKKIILTTDQELIKDGIQAIHDEFLEWFVKNPSCDFVDVVYGFFNPMGRQVDPNDLGQNHSKCVWKYKIIIPKEEPKQELPTVNGSYGCTIPIKEHKQETLEEVAENYKIKTIKSGRSHRVEYTKQIKLDFISGAKWQQEQDKNKYSEEEVRKISLDFFYHWWNSKGTNTEQGFDRWFEQLKK